MAFFSFLLFSFSWVFCSSILNFTGAGGGAPSIIFQDWFYAYSGVKPDIHMAYMPIGTGSGEAKLFGNQVDFGGLDEPLSPADRANYTSLFTFPVFAQATVPQINLPVYGANVVLRTQTLADIFRGNITQWSDAQILADQTLKVKLTLSTLPNPNITVVYRTGISGTTRQLTMALSSFSAVWNQTYGVFDEWPPALTKLPNFRGADSMFQAFSTIIVRNSSIGYVSNSFLQKQALEFAQYAQLKTDDGQVLTPSIHNIQAAMETATLDQYLDADFINPPNTTCWPISALSYVAIDLNFTEMGCSKARELMRFWHWALTEPLAIDRLKEDGYAQLTPEFIEQVLGRLTSIACESNVLLANVESDRKGDPVFLVLIAISFILCAGVFFLSIFHIYQFRKPLIGMVYAIFTMIGGLAAIGATFFWVAVPSSSLVCEARIWLTSLGFSVLLGSMFGRMSQLREVYVLQKSLSKLVQADMTAKTSIIKLCLSLLVIFLLNAAILAAWRITDPYSATFVLKNDVDTTGMWCCESKHTFSWAVAEGVFFGTLILWGLVVIYQTWSLHAKILMVEMRWVFLSLYNIILNCAVISPFFYFTEVDDDSLALAMVISINFSTGGIVLAVLVPRLLKPAPKEKQTTRRDGQSVSNYRIRIRGERRGESVAGGSTYNMDSTGSTYGPLPDTQPAPLIRVGSLQAEGGGIQRNESISAFYQQDLDINHAAPTDQEISETQDHLLKLQAPLLSPPKD